MKKTTFEQFFTKARKVHGEAYSYNAETFRSLQHKLEIICPVHGPFFQKANNHISLGHRCPRCHTGRGIRRSVEDILQRCKHVHGDKYTYELDHPIKAKDEIKVICPLHGVFCQTLDAHLNQASGCPRCGIQQRAIKQRLTDDEIKAKVYRVYGGRYKCGSDLHHREDHKIIPLECEKHGTFSLSLNGIDQGHRCPSCARRFGKMQNEWLLSLGIDRKYWQKRVYLVDGSFIVADAFDGRIVIS